jgi:t-SNARE complex subunit (syntaxin)
MEDEGVADGGEGTANKEGSSQAQQARTLIKPDGGICCSGGVIVIVIVVVVDVVVVDVVVVVILPVVALVVGSWS